MLEMKAELKNIKVGKDSHYVARSAAFRAGVTLQQWIECAIAEKLKKEKASK